MVDITNRELRLHVFHPHGFQLQIGHRAGGILSEGLIDADGDFPAGFEIAVGQMLLMYLGGQTLSHDSPQYYCNAKGSGQLRRILNGGSTED